MVQKMVFYSIHVISEYNLSGSKIICRQIPGALPKYFLSEMQEILHFVLHHPNRRKVISLTHHIMANMDIIINLIQFDQVFLSPGHCNCNYISLFVSYIKQSDGQVDTQVDGLANRQTEATQCIMKNSKMSWTCLWTCSPVYVLSGFVGKSINADTVCRIPNRQLTVPQC